MPLANRIPEWSLGDRLKKARTAAGIERPAMRDQLLSFGISAPISTIGAWETDTNRPSDPRVLLAWAEITGVDASWLSGVRSSSRPPDGEGGEIGAQWVARGSNPEPAGSMPERRAA